MAINWGLAQQPNAFERAFSQGREAAMQQRAMQREEEGRNALASYVMKPNEAGFNALAMAAPEYAMQVQGQRQQAEREAAERAVRARAFAGEPAAVSELAAFDTNAARGLTSDQRQRMSDLAEVSANVSQMVLNLPPEQQAGAWQQQMQILAQRGYPELADYADQYTPEFAQSTIAEAGQWRQFDQDQQPDTFNVTAGGSVYQRDRNGVVSPVIVPNYNGAPAGAPAGPQGGYSAPAGVPSGSPLVSIPTPQAQTRQSPLFPAAEWREYTRAMGTSLPAIVERDRPVIVNSQGAQVQTDVINGQIAYLVNGVWYDNPEGQ